MARSLATFVKHGMALPTVVVGLVAAVALYRGGPLGGLYLIHTSRPMTEVLTTAIVEAVGRGDFGPAIAFGVVLVGLAFVVNALLTSVQQRGAPWTRACNADRRASRDAGGSGA